MWQEKFNLFVTKLAELRAEDIGNSDMIGVSAVEGYQSRKINMKDWEPYERYATERKGFWLKTSLSINRFSISHPLDIGTALGGSEIW